jgi:membrane-anchored protein YejM (alkaline phosphatase superfamily)
MFLKGKHLLSIWTTFFFMKRRLFKMRSLIQTRVETVLRFDVHIFSNYILHKILRSPCMLALSAPNKGSFLKQVANLNEIYILCPF